MKSSQLLTLLTSYWCRLYNLSLPSVLLQVILLYYPFVSLKIVVRFKPFDTTEFKTESTETDSIESKIPFEEPNTSQNLYQYLNKSDSQKHLKQIKCTELETDSEDKKIFTFDDILVWTSQNYVFHTVALPLLNDILQHQKNCTIISFGWRSTGTTYTLLGPEITSNVTPNNSANMGLISKCLQYLFNHKIQTISFAMYQIIDRKITDLIPENETNKNSKTRLHKVRETRNGNIEITGLKYYNCNNLSMILLLIAKGIKKSKIIRNIYFINRSNYIELIVYKFKISINNKNVLLIFVDFGCFNRFGVSNEKHNKLINKSLKQLSDLLCVLNPGKGRYFFVPFRDSIFTHSIKDSMIPNCNVRLIVNVSSEKVKIEQTLKALKFARNCTKGATKH